MDQRHSLEQKGLQNRAGLITLLGMKGNFVSTGRFTAALRRFDAANAEDPTTELVDGSNIPRELAYAMRLFGWVIKLEPKASEALLLASRCQHLCRWEIPRTQYPMDRPGYLKWRTDLKKFHAQKAGEILETVGYARELIEEVQALNLKKNFPSDPQSQVLEDALCLVFLQYQFADLAAKTEESKVINALQKSWKKMSPRAREEALKLPYAPGELALIQKALGGE